MAIPRAIWILPAAVLFGVVFAWSDSVTQLDRLVVVGKLAEISTPPHCGTVHFGAIAQYTVIRTIEGDYALPTIGVVHGCPELRREDYGKDRGDLKVFRIGDIHRLVLTDFDAHGDSITLHPVVRDAPKFFAESVRLCGKISGSD